ncbi:MAG: hypothetical protein ABR956_04350 [Terracidiphilus sp.]|jgi:hypothetical protein
MKTKLELVAFLLGACAAAGAQVAPEATSGAAYLHYSFHYGQSAEVGGLGNEQMSNASADVSYANGNGRTPFVMDYGGGYSWNISGPSYGSGIFQHLTASQGLNWHKWNFNASDNVSYLPASATTGFTGVPGTGEPIGGPGTNPPTDEGILTLHTPIVANDVSGSAGHRLGYATTISMGGGSDKIYFPDGNGIETSGESATVGLSRRLSARSSLTGSYAFSRYSYSEYVFSFMSNSVFAGFSRTWNRKLSTTVSAGPQWVGTLNGQTALSTTTETPAAAAEPIRTTFGANASASYHNRAFTGSLSYSRGTSGGSGYLLGQQSDSINANLAKTLGRKLNIGIDGSYQRIKGLEASGVVDAKFGGAQASYGLGRYLSTFASYTAVGQSSSATLPGNAISGLYQIISFGLSYSPRETHLTH